MDQYWMHTYSHSHPLLLHPPTSTCMYTHTYVPTYICTHQYTNTHNFLFPHCQDCWIGHLKSQIDFSQLLNAKCPIRQCTLSCTRSFIEEVFNGDVEVIAKVPGVTVCVFSELPQYIVYIVNNIMSTVVHYIAPCLVYICVLCNTMFTSYTLCMAQYVHMFTVFMQVMLFSIVHSLRVLW